MRKAILESEKTQTFLASKANSDLYYGTLVGKNQKGFITKTIYGDGEFVVRSLNALTIGNGWGYLGEYKNLKDLIETYVHNGDAVYEFDTYQELFEWLLEK